MGIARIAALGPFELRLRALIARKCPNRRRKRDYQLRKKGNHELWTYDEYS
jgi:hypothetical protein